MAGIDKIDDKLDMEDFDSFQAKIEEIIKAVNDIIEWINSQ